ncbi:unnamed protein product [Caenorhabditis auriculariae]|uniref:Uncharacterized protein n=1 Tax=Caenorhabditis auriculariae TaxID=2777116 RepID=A0A8S1HB78_9PELO|nr:unnamed protein product [Caenorhabditis auriculariae]
MTKTEGFGRLFQNFENVIAPKECKMTGTVPKYLKGTMVRNGPGMFEIGDSKYNHWFDGMAYIQRYHFQDGKMFYSARYLESEDYLENMKKQRIVRSGFATTGFPDPCKTVYQRFFSHFFGEDPKHDNANVSFAEVGDGVYAVTETPQMIRIDLDTLKPAGTADMTDYIALNTCTAHQLLDDAGNVFNVGSKFGKDAFYVFAITKNPLDVKGAQSGHSIEDTKIVGTVPCSETFHPSYYHSFGMSQNYLLLFESPVRLDIKKILMRKFTFVSYGECLYWKKNVDVKVLIVDKRTGKQKSIKYTANPFFTFHHANSFEKDGCLVVDYCRMENAGNFETLLMENMKDGTFQKNPNFLPYLTRMIIPLEIPSDAKTGDDLLAGLAWAKGCKAELRKNGSVHLTEKRLCEHTMEFPRYHSEKINMREYRYCYGSSVLGKAADNDLEGVIKVDVQGGKPKVWKRENQFQVCAEPIFVPDPNGVEEDDGILLVPIMTLRDGENPFVVILNAHDLKEIARYTIPEARIPLGFHALYKKRFG